MNETIEMPKIVRAKILAEYLGASVSHVKNMASAKQFKPGIYIGRGRYNMSKLKAYIENPPYRYCETSINDQIFCKGKRII